MMVESAVLVSIGTSLASALLKPVLKKSVDALSKSNSAAGLKSAILGNLEPKLVNLEQELRKLDDFLCCAENLNPVQHNRNNIVLGWLKKIKEAANFADNLLDDISYDQLRRQAERGKVANLLSGSDGTSFEFRRKIGSKMSKFQSMIAKIYKEAADIGLSPVDLLANPTRYQPPAAMSTDLREIRENVNTSLVVGRQAEEDLIVPELSRPDIDQALGVIAIVGMSGVGKTTLARKIYDNETVTKNYKHKAWIFVSQDFSVRRLLNEMLQSLSGVNHNMSNIDAMEKKLQGCLQRDKYLLVLDDVWNTNWQVWDSLRSSLVRVTGGCTGSKVLVTTQSSEVASVMGAYLSQRVEVLYKDDAWALFEGKAFANKSQQQVLELRDVGERILRKCGGLPLAINTLTSLLTSMDKLSQWESVDRSQVWKLSEGQTKIMPWLLLSFNHLPSAATKQCFAHCCMIPKGARFGEEFLTQWWIAQGFIQPSETSDDPNMVDIPRMHINSMLANNLLQSVAGMKPKQFTMHDLIHDLALYVSMDSSLIISDSSDLHNASVGVEHVSIYGGGISISLPDFPKGNTQITLRTLICHSTPISINLVAQAIFLRQLHLISCGLKEIPSSIGGLKHLRILELNDNPFEYLPKTIGKLYNLLTLSLGQCHRLVDLPQQVTKLLNLRAITTSEAVHMPKGMGQLTCLTNLPVVKLKAGDGCKITELKSLLHLRGIVKIKQLENISSKEDAVEAGLKNKEGIADLKLIWTSEGHEDNIVCSNDEEVMEGLQPHSNLEGLQVDSFRGKRFSQWLSNGLHCNNLTHLNLLNCKRCEQLPTLGCLPSLKYISIDGMESVEIIGRELFYMYDQSVAACSSSGISLDGTSQNNLFPSLEKLELLNMPKLKEWLDPSGSCASAFPCLEELSLINCPLLVSAPTCFTSLQRLTIKGINSGGPLLMVLSNSCNLTSLTVENVHQLTCLSESLLKCTCLRLLKIKSCKELVELPPTLQSMGCLESLEVSKCKSLTSLPDIEGLLSLNTLLIWLCENITDAPRGIESCVSIEDLRLTGCPKLNLIPDLASLSRLKLLSFTAFSKQMSIPPWINQLSRLYYSCMGNFNNELDDFRGINQLPKCLKTLHLNGWPKLKSLPKELQYLTHLEELGIWKFEGVVALPEWLGNLSSLIILDILNCENLKHLPSFDVMRKLTRLRELIIEGCPELEKRCREEGGDEWNKISHLPTVTINDE